MALSFITTVVSLVIASPLPLPLLLPPSPLPKPQPEESQENRIATASAGPVPEQGRNNFERFFAEALEGGTMEVGAEAPS